jgi:hypothetical protein
MNAFRSTVMAAAACAAGLSLAACTAAISTVGAAKPASPADTQASTSSAASSASSAAQTAPGCAASGGMVTLSAPVGSFPVPPGAQVVEDVSGGKGRTGIVLSSVTPSVMEAFYTSTLPRDGYKITVNEEGLGTPELIFQGHGYTGVVAAAAGMGKVPKLPAGTSAKVCPGVSLSAVGKNIVWLSFEAGSAG